MSCSWWQIPIRSDPLLETNCPHTYIPIPLTPSTPLARTLLQRQHQQFRFLDPEYIYPLGVADMRYFRSSKFMEFYGFVNSVAQNSYDSAEF